MTTVVFVTVDINIDATLRRAVKSLRFWVITSVSPAAMTVYDDYAGD